MRAVRLSSLDVRQRPTLTEPIPCVSNDRSQRGRPNENLPTCVLILLSGCASRQVQPKPPYGALFTGVFAMGYMEVWIESVSGPCLEAIEIGRFEATVSKDGP